MCIDFQGCPFFKLLIFYSYQDRGLEVPKIYGNEWFRESFRVFCLGYKPQMEKLEVALEPHPWQQYRYPLAKKDKTDQTSYPSKSGKSVQN